MKKTTVLIALLIVILISLTTLLLTLKNPISLYNPPQSHSHTKAICDSTNYCQDYEISCENDKMIKIRPITGAAIQFSSAWKDPREEKIRDKIC